MAKVNNQAVVWGEVDNYLATRFPNQQFSDASRKIAEQAALDHLVERRIVFEFLVEKKYAPGRTRIEAQLDKIREQAKVQGETLEEVARKQNLTVQQFRFEAAWKLGWSRYLELKFGDDVIERFFEENKTRFDGTKWDVSQILIPGTFSSEKEVKEIKARLNEVRRSVLNGQETWAEAVMANSQAASRERGGRIGWVGIDGPMDREFNEQLLHLQRG